MNLSKPIEWLLITLHKNHTKRFYSKKYPKTCKQLSRKSA